MFSEDIVYSKLNKKALDVLCRAGAIPNLVDERFTGAKHFWMACIQDRPKSVKKLAENIELYSPEGDFSSEEKIEYVSSLTGMFPFSLVMSQNVMDAIDKYCVPPVGSWDNKLGVAWFIPRQIIPKKTKNDKPYWLVKVIDDTSTTTTIKCWGIKEHDVLHLNRPYAAKLDYSDEWGFSSRSVRGFKLLG